MKTLKKTLCLVLVFAMMLSVCVFGSAAAYKDEDTIKSQYKEAVAVLTGLDIFHGYTDGNFKPQNTYNRAEAATIIVNMLGLGDIMSASTATFKDVKADDWFYPAITWCAREGVIYGYGSDIFGPGDLLTREQMVTILHQYAKYKETSLRSDADMSRFTDTDDISAWAVDNMRWAVTNGLLSGSSKELRPKDIVTRAELASALYSYTLNTELSGKPLLP